MELTPEEYPDPADLPQPEYRANCGRLVLGEISGANDLELTGDFSSQFYSGHLFGHELSCSAASGRPAHKLPTLKDSH